MYWYRLPGMWSSWRNSLSGMWTSWTNTVCQVRNPGVLIQVIIYSVVEIVCQVANPGVLIQDINSPELKAQVSFSDHNLSIVHCRCRKFSDFLLRLQNHWANFNQTWYKASLGKGDSNLYKWRTTPLSKGRW